MKIDCIERHCFICGKPFLIRKERGRPKSNKISIRPINSKTCSRECSREYLNLRYKFNH